MPLVDPQTGFFSEQTQLLNNRLPEWHAGRRLRTSNWAKLTNSLVGEHLDDLRIQQDRAFRNLYLVAAHLDETDIIRRSQMLATVNLNPKFTNVNILRNGAFFFRARPDKVGDYWSHSGTVAVGDGLFGSRAAQLTPASSETSSISQTITLGDAWGVGDSRTLSCWYKIPNWAGGTIPTSSHGLIVAVTYHDTTTQTFRTAFSQNTDNQWRRITLTAKAVKSVASYVVKLETIRSASFDINVPISIDAVQAQAGTAATNWASNLQDRPLWFSSERFFPIEVEAEEDVFLTDSLRDFYYESVPTRLSLLRTTDVSSESNRGGGLSVLIDYDKIRWSAIWDVNTTTNKIRLVGLDPADIYLSADISFFTGTETGPKYEEGVTGLDYFCAAKFGHWLYVVHEMPGLNGTSELVLSVCSPRTPFPRGAYLESRNTISLPLSTGVDYHSLEFRFEDPQHLYIALPTQEFLLRLYYDYAMIDDQTLELFLREQYSKVSVVR